MQQNNFSSLITRIEDMPYFRCPPTQFSLSQGASLSFGQYIWNGSNAPRTIMTGAKNITASTLLYLRTVGFSADIPVLDYQKALEITSTVVANGTTAGTPDIPKFSMFLQANHNAPSLKDPILCRNYLEKQAYRLIIEPKQTPDALTGFFRGALQQTAELAGVNTINATIEFYVQTIESTNFINALKKEYPDLSKRGYLKF
jgi:hypothetical protein